MPDNIDGDIPSAPPAAETDLTLETVAHEIAHETGRLVTAEVNWPPVSYWMKVAVGILLVFAIANMLIALRQIIILLLVSMILAIGLQPGVNFLVRKGFRRGSAVALIFFTATIVIGGFMAMITPAIIRQLAELVDKGPEYLKRAQRQNGFIADLNERFNLVKQLENLAKDLPSTALSLVKSFTALLFNALTVMILTLYFTTALPKMEEGIARLLRRENREDFQRILEESTGLVGGYMLGNLVVSLVAGTVSFIALAIIGVPYAVALAFWVALADLVPTVGALLGALVAVLVAIFAGPGPTVATIAFFVVYQQIENYVIAPRVMKRTVQMSAAAVIVAVLIGGTLAGFPGALLALPTAAIIKVTLQRLYLDARLETVRVADAEDAARTQRRRRLFRRHEH